MKVFQGNRCLNIKVSWKHFVLHVGGRDVWGHVTSSRPGNSNICDVWKDLDSFYEKKNPTIVDSKQT